MFGWDYPPGAENDPNAPYNECEPDEEPDDFHGNDDESDVD